MDPVMFRYFTKPDQIHQCHVKQCETTVYHTMPSPRFQGHECLPAPNILDVTVSYIERYLFATSTYCDSLPPLAITFRGY